jgi:hypothetical protein
MLSILITHNSLRPVGLSVNCLKFASENRSRNVLNNEILQLQTTKK